MKCEWCGDSREQMVKIVDRIERTEILLCGNCAVNAPQMSYMPSGLSDLIDECRDNEFKPYCYAKGCPLHEDSNPGSERLVSCVHSQRCKALFSMEKRFTLVMRMLRDHLGRR